MGPRAKHMGQPGKSWMVKNQHSIKSNPKYHINMMISMNCLHLSTHHDIDHFHHYFGNDQEAKKKVCPNEAF